MFNGCTVVRFFGRSGCKVASAWLTDPMAPPGGGPKSQDFRSAFRSGSWFSDPTVRSKRVGWAKSAAALRKHSAARQMDRCHRCVLLLRSLRNIGGGWRLSDSVTFV